MKKRRSSRNIAIIAIFFMLFANLNLTVFATTYNNSTDWNFASFGSNTSDSKNQSPTNNGDGSLTMLAEGGKIASNEIGVSLQYLTLNAADNFTIKTTAYADSYSPDGQRAFGLMILDKIGEDTGGKNRHNYVAVGGLDGDMRGFYSKDGYNGGGLTKLDVFQDNVGPATGESYDLEIRKSGDTFVVTSNGESETFKLENALSEQIYVGLFVARNGKITFSNTEVNVSDVKTSSLDADASDMKTEYLVGEELELDGLKVTAVNDDNTETEVSAQDLIVTGFDSSSPGTNTITINYNGAETTVNLEIIELALTNMEVKYYPAKSDYYLGDRFDSLGLVVIGSYNDGYYTEVLSSDDYTFEIGGVAIDSDFTFDDSGEKIVTIRSTEAEGVTTEFNVNVSDATLETLEVTQLPEKIQYYLGDELDLDGIVVEAEYSDGASVRLTRDEFAVSELDTSTVGDKEVTVYHKNKEATFPVNVKEKELVEIRVTDYPQTTFTVGDTFNSDSLEVSKVYDNGDEEVLASDDYGVDSSNFVSENAGVYTITVNPKDTTIEPTSYDVTVRDEANVEWKEIQFGQSTGSDTNYIEELDNGGIKIVAEGNSSGKITGDHDGITFYYTEIDAEDDNFTLSADIKVNDYAKDPHDGQESFGIMARDAIGENDNSSVFASNIAAVGGFSGGTQEDNGTQLFIRTGVESSDGAGSKGVQKQMLQVGKPTTENTYPAQDYRLTLSKTNSGFTGQINDGEEAIFFEPDILNVQDDKIYVGFYTARKADIEVYNIDFDVTAAATDAPKVDPPAEPVAPTLDIVSRDKASEEDYELLLKSNVAGTVTVKAGQEVIGSNLEVTQGELVEVPAKLTENTDTNFSITFLPDDTQYLTSYEKIVKNFTVSMKTFRDGADIYVAPDGTSDGDGTAGNPLDLDTAIEYVQPGQKIIVAGGNYVRDSKLEISKYNDGTADARKYLVAAEGARPVIDFDKRSEGGILSGNYWHVKGIDFARSAANTKGFVVGGSNNIVEDSRFYENGDTGLQISRTDASAPRAEWPSNNLILNSESFDNADPSQNNGDGFAAKLTVGDGNIFRGTISHNNIDDGYDLYTKVGSGAIGAVIIEDSIAYGNGTLTDGTVGEGDKNGFKLGGEGVYVPHIIRNSIAFNNGATGFTSNSNPGVIAENIVAYNNGKNIDFSTYDGIEEAFQLSGVMSYQNVINTPDSYPEYAESDDNYFFDGEISKNASGDILTEENFVSLNPEIPYERDKTVAGLEANIIWGDFLSYIPNVMAEVEFRPTVLKLNEKKSEKAKENNNAALTAYVQFANDSILDDIDFDSILLNDEVAPATKQKNDPIVDFDDDGVKEYKVVFPRQQLLNILEQGEQELVVTGKLTNGQKFRATTTITVK
ncbi:bacterial Ig-like domain-containing protein [Aquibacillus salsiterrae]|uniref:Bacterial Ig-like domain-containing protein n=1 Tax=Aquibacillus salsiterrae TaxID=2950439 RepID=A0A9X3WEI2_9BACI|nr:bacterial Ig-like domain-containing protein [Aquibacillus salsiterrae]MDC3415949.1 bacterial Ig-like domain-containing protein [Aquibacillus salsiterrae]